MVEFVDSKLNEQEEINSKTLATKQDLSELKSHLDSKVTDLLKWNIVMWISQMAAIAALLKLFH